MGGGVRLTRHDPWRGTRQQPLVLHATWQLYPAAIHDEVQFICSGMYGGGAKRASFKNIFETGSNLFQIWAKNKKIPTGSYWHALIYMFPSFMCAPNPVLNKSTLHQRRPAHPIIHENIYFCPYIF